MNVNGFAYAWIYAIPQMGREDNQLASDSHRVLKYDDVESYSADFCGGVSGYDFDPLK